MIRNSHHGFTEDKPCLTNLITLCNEAPVSVDEGTIGKQFCLPWLNQVFWHGFLKHYELVATTRVGKQLHCMSQRTEVYSMMSKEWLHFRGWYWCKYCLTFSSLTWMMGGKVSFCLWMTAKWVAKWVSLYAGLYTGLAFKRTSANLTMRYLVKFGKNRHTWAGITPCNSIGWWVTCHKTALS